VLQKLGPDAAEAATATGIPAGAAVPAELFLKDLAKLTPAQKLAELSARQSARAKGALEPLGDVAERARLGREVPYRMGEPTGVNGLNEAGPLSKMTSMAPGETAPGSIALNDASKISDIPAFEKAMADIPTTDNGLAGIKQALKKPFSHEDFTKQLRDSLDTAKATSDTFAGSDIDLSNESQLSPLDAASRLARLSRIQRASGAAYAE
jgi:hypothetical protein